MSHAASLGVRPHSCARKWTAKHAGARDLNVATNWKQIDGLQ